MNHALCLCCIFITRITPGLHAGEKTVAQMIVEAIIIHIHIRKDGNIVEIENMSCT